MGYIYILTNPSFKEYIKIGYAADVDQRLKVLNSNPGLPFAFRVYATYEVNSDLSDKKLHSILDKLNPDLRSIEEYEGKTRKREFYAMSPEDAYTFEHKILINNKKIKTILLCNQNLFQTNPQKEYSNAECVHNFLQHIDEFEATRGVDEKIRQVLFPEDINSIFGITPISDHLMPNTESLEALITVLSGRGAFLELHIGIEKPYFVTIEENQTKKVFLDDTPQLRQIYFDNKCFRKCKVRLDSINHALKIIRSRGISFSFDHTNNLREIHIDGKKMVFVYEYCLSKAELYRLCPEKGSLIVNLRNWNGESCISNEAYDAAEEMGFTLLTMKKFYEYVDGIKGSNT